MSYQTYRQCVRQSLFSFVRDLSIDDALHSEDVLVQALAVVDARIGKRTLRSLNEDDIHPLAKELLRVRRDAEALSGAA